MEDLFSNITREDVYLAILSLGVAVVFYFLYRDLKNNNKSLSRIKAIQERRLQLKNNLIAPKKRRKSDYGKSVGLMRLIVGRLNLLKQSQVGKIGKMLLNAGYRSKDAIFVFAFFRIVSPILLIPVGLMVFDIDFSDPLANSSDLLMLAGFVFSGAYLPYVILKNKIGKRYYAIQKGLSDMLDMLLICSEAGLSLAAAIDRVAKELGFTYPELAEELTITSIELGFLPDRKKALTNLAERVDMQEIRGITSVLIQTEKYGTPVSQALRVLGSEFRTQRMLRAEQKAARLPAIMTIPMMIFILPTLFVMILSPAVMSTMATFGK